MYISMVDHMASKDVEFKLFSEIQNEPSWRYKSNRPIGQKWFYDDGFCTNRCGEEFRIPRNTDSVEINIVIDALNIRDAEIYNLKLQLKRYNKHIDRLKQDRALLEKQKGEQS